MYKMREISNGRHEITEDGAIVVVARSDLAPAILEFLLDVKAGLQGGKTGGENTT